MGNDIFTGHQVEDLVPAGRTISVPFVKKEEYEFIDLDDDDWMTLLTADGEKKEDIKLPEYGTLYREGADELAQKIRDLFEEEKDFYIIVQVACGTWQVIDAKVMSEAK